jgi:protein involved in polysaccharide export with SLBB domain
MKTLTAITIFLLVSSVSAIAQENASLVPIKASVSSPTATPRPLTEIYRVGAGDILDIRLLNSANGNRSTLFTVVDSGLIDMPVAGGTISVAGLTPDEIQNVIAAELKRRAVVENAQVSVTVRQYLSHAVTVTGLVIHPGTRFLRREMMPLYVILAESQLRNDGGRVLIMRGGTPGEPHDLSDPATLNLNVQSGDIITVSSRPEEFYYIGGRVNYPGQKQFQPGITLLQAILAAGGTTRQETKVEISREGEGGKLVTSTYNLKQIKSGAVQDPKLAAGDRIEVAK